MLGKKYWLYVGCHSSWTFCRTLLLQDVWTPGIFSWTLFHPVWDVSCLNIAADGLQMKIPYTITHFRCVDWPSTFRPNLMRQDFPCKMYGLAWIDSLGDHDDDSVSRTSKVRRSCSWIYQSAMFRVGTNNTNSRLNLPSSQPYSKPIWTCSSYPQDLPIPSGGTLLE